jgi:hypothetical protein
VHPTSQRTGTLDVHMVRCLLQFKNGVGTGSVFREPIGPVPRSSCHYVPSKRFFEPFKFTVSYLTFATKVKRPFLKMGHSLLGHATSIFGKDDGSSQ